MTIYNLIKKFKEDESIARVTQNNLSNFFSCNEAGISRIIAWLLDSEETHELGNKFSKAFIKQLNKKAKLGLSVNALNKAIIVCEYPIRHNNQNRRLDILITTDELCIVIENKFGCKEHNNQLNCYKKYFEDARKKKQISSYFVYLDVNYDESGEENTINSDWIALNYDWILDFLNENIQSVAKEAKPVLSEFRAMIEEYDLSDDIDELCLKHHELIDEVEQIRQEKVTDFIFSKSSFNLELFKVYKKYQWIFDWLISHNKFYHNITLANDICNSIRYKNTVKYNITKNTIEFTHRDTYDFAKEQDIYWGSYIILETVEHENRYSLKLYFNLEQCDENKKEEIKEKIYEYREKTIGSTAKRVLVLEYEDVSKRSLADRFDELFSILKKLQKVYVIK